MPVPISSYSQLLAEVSDWLNRQDLDNQIPTFVRLFEAKANRKLRTHDMVQRKTAIVNNDFFAVPDDWKETISFARICDNGAPIPLEFVSIENSLTKRQDWLTGPTHFYTHIDGKFLLIPGPQSDNPVEFELIYRAGITNLKPADTTPAVDTNWLLARSPDLYLYGTLVEAEQYLKNDERVPLWKQNVAEIFAEMQMEADRAAFPQGRLVARRKGF